ncbi:MAG: MFS transporter, partial [Firmicutes bacterium]|nr:MFS transporter [Bacillota bacterium]
IAGILCGTMVVSHGSPIVQTQLGMGAEAAAVIVSVFSLANMAGRFAWGTISDRLGRLNTTKILYVCMVAGMAGMFLFHVTVPFVASMVLVMFCYGGLASLMAPLTSNLFGAKYITENYGIVFTVYGISSLIATPLAAKILETTGVYDMAFLVGLGFAAVGLICNLIVAVKEKKLRKA